jgi:hypothetical protein
MEFTINPLVFVVLFAIIFSIIIVFIIYGKKSKQTTIESSTNYGRDEIEKILSTIFFVIGGIPLCIYPFVMVANLMSLAGVWPAHVSILLLIVFGLFLLATSTYPITYIICILRFKKGGKKISLSIIPLLHILATIGFGFLWGLLEAKNNI